MSEPSHPANPADSAPTSTHDHATAHDRATVQGNRSVAMVAATVAAVAAMAGVWLLPVPYAISSPGPTVNVLGDVGDDAVLSVEGATTYDSDGTLDLVTISVTGGPGRRTPMGGLLDALIDPDRVAQPVLELYPKAATPGDVKEQGAAEMSESQAAATAAAMRHLNRPVKTVVTIAGFDDQGTAKETLKVGDVLRRIGDVEVSDTESVRAATSALAPSTPVSVTVLRDGSEKTVEVTPHTSAEGPVRLGVLIAPDFEFDVDVTFGVGDIGGPSAGLVFALGIVEKLTPGTLITESTAGTGTMGADGAVGAIGGIALKMEGAKRDGASWFLAPQANCTDVVGNIPDGLAVISVATLDDAVDALTKVDSGDTDDLPRCTA